MRHVASVVVLAFAVILAGADAPQPSTGIPAGMPATVAGGPAGASDFIDRTETAPMVARGHVLARPTGGDQTYAVHVDRWLKASGPSDLVVNFGGQRALTPEGNAEILFLAPTLHADAGKESADLRTVGKSAEHYTVPDAQTGLIDQVVQDILARAPEDQVLMEMVQLPPPMSEPAASRLALRSAKGGAPLAAADTAVQSPNTCEAAREMLVTLLGGRLPMSTLVPLASKGHGDRIRMTALTALGRMAANQPSQREKATQLLEAAASDGNPHIEFAAGVALASYGRASALKPLDAILAGTDAPLRAEAVRALASLARFGNAGAYQRLQHLKSDGDKEVATRAKNLLAQLGPAAAPEKAVSSKQVFAVASVALVAVLVLLGVWVLRRRKA